MKTFVIIAISIAVLAALTIIIIIATQRNTSPPPNIDLRWEPERIRAAILEAMPMGTHIDDVVNIVEAREDWEEPLISFEHGFLHPRPHLLDPDHGWPISPLSGQPIIGEQSIRASIGDYRRNTLTGNVTVLWGFDENGSLIEVYVWKTYR